MVPNTSCFSEIDVSSKSAYPHIQRNDVYIARRVCDYNSALRDDGLENAQSTDIVQAIRGKIIRVVQTDGALPGDKCLVLAVAGPDDVGLSELKACESLATTISY